MILKMLNTGVQVMDNVIVYPMKKVSLDEFRRDNYKLGTNGEKKSSFLNLFEQRLKKCKGHRQKVSILLIVHAN